MDLYVGVVLAVFVFLASLISLELGLSAAIIEISLGVVVGNVLFIYGQQETTGERIIRFVSSLLPKEQAPPVLDVRPDVPLY